MSETKTAEQIAISVVVNILLGVIIYPWILSWLWNLWIPVIFPGAPHLDYWTALELQIVAGFLIRTNS